MSTINYQLSTINYQLLILTPQLPYPPRQGTTIRNYNLIAQLAQRHNVDLLTFVAPGEHLEEGNPLYELCDRIAAIPQPERSLMVRALDTLRSPLPDMALRLESAAMHRQVQSWLQDKHYDIVQVEGIEMAQYGTHGLAAGAKVIFDDHNCEYLLQQRAALTDLRQPRRWVAALYSLVQWAKLRRYERQVSLHSDGVVAVSEPDKQALLRLAPDQPMAVVPNGIDLGLFSTVGTAMSVELVETDCPLRQAQGTKELPYKLVFTGKMDYRPNIDAVLWFGQRVLPLIQNQISDVLFQIVGMNPHPRLDVLQDNPAIEITGAVDHTQPYIQNATVYVIPMRVGGGTRFKVLEAMACGKAVVSTRLGVEGFAVEEGRELLLADQPDAFAQMVVRLLQDQAEGGGLTQQLGQEARRFVEEGYTWAQIVPQLEKFYNQGSDA